MILLLGWLLVTGLLVGLLPSTLREMDNTPAHEGGHV